MGKKTEKAEAKQRQMQFEAEQADAKKRADAAREPMRMRINARRKSIDNKDYANNTDFINNTSIAAQANQQIQNQANLQDTGIAGLASSYADPTQVAMGARLIKDKMAQNSGMQYESDVKDFVRETSAMETDMMNSETGYYSNLSGQAAGQAFQNQNLAAQIAMQQSSWLPQAIGMGLQGFSSVWGATHPK